jgi:hypothetical protein
MHYFKSCKQILLPPSLQFCENSLGLTTNFNKLHWLGQSELFKTDPVCNNVHDENIYFYIIMYQLLLLIL